MIDDCITGSLYARSTGLVRAVNDFSIVLPTKAGVTAVATVSLTSVAFGATLEFDRDSVSGQLGTTASAIVSHIRMGASGPVSTDVPTFEPVNQLRITRCVAVTFRLVATMADVRAVASVLLLSPSAGSVLRRGTELVAVVFDKMDGAIWYTHRRLLHGAVRPPSPKAFMRASLTAAAAALDRNPRELSVAVTNARHVTPGAARMDRRSGKVVAVRTSAPADAQSVGRLVFSPPLFK